MTRKANKLDSQTVVHQSVESTVYWDVFDNVALNCMPEAVVAIDNDDTIRYLNAAACRLYGKTHSVAFGSHISTLFNHKWLVPEHRDEARSEFSATGSWLGINEHLRSDGTPFLAETTSTLLRDSIGNRIGVLAVVRDISERRDADRLHKLATDLQNRVAEFETLFNVIPVGIHYATDPDCRVIRSNPTGATMFDMTVDDNLSHSAPEGEAPTSFIVVDGGLELPASELPLQKAISLRAKVEDRELTVRFTNGQQRTILVNAAPLVDEGGNVYGGIASVSDITALRQAEQALADSEERYRAIISCLEEGIVVRDASGKVVATNASASRILGLPPERLIESWAYGSDWYAVRDDGVTIAPDDMPSTLTLATGQPQRDKTIGIVVAGQGMTWVSMNCQPLRHLQSGTTVGVVTSFYDITDKRQALALLRDSEERLRLAIEGASIGTWHWDISEDRVVCSDIMRKLRRIPSSSPVTLEGFLSNLPDEDRLRKRNAVYEALATGQDYELQLSMPDMDGGVRWFAEHGRPYYDDEGRPMRMEGIAWDITDQKAAEDALRSRVQRESTVNRVGEAIRQSTVPSEIQKSVVNVLGESLALERCWIIMCDRSTDTVTTGPDWHASHLRSYEGLYRLSEFDAVYDDLFGSGTCVIHDYEAADYSFRTISALDRFGLRACIAVPYFDDGMLVGALFAGMSSARIWTNDETMILEQCASLTRSAVESALARSKEQTIAHQLQEALQPVIPSHAPGLRLASYYRAALDEAGVGGDFSDVFSLDDSVTYVVVGDLAGKGLAAASQVATVRNMLRYSLYQGNTSVAESVTTLNTVLASHELLTGFATLFVAQYDHKTRCLTYVNCGQDPALILSRDRVVERALSPTGTVLGITPHAKFVAEQVQLTAGDVLVVYTDGFSEAGPSRSALLQTSGIERMLSDMSEIDNPQVVVTNLVSRVNEYTQGGRIDDQCLLVAVVTD